MQLNTIVYCTNQLTCQKFLKTLFLCLVGLKTSSVSDDNLPIASHGLLQAVKEAAVKPHSSSDF